MAVQAREPYENAAAADEVARRLGIAIKTDAATGEHVYDIVEVARALKVSVEEVFDLLADEDGNIVLASTADLEPGR